MTMKLNRRNFLTATAGATLAGAMPMSLAHAADKLKIGIVYVSPMADIGWTKQHALGVEAIKQAMGDKVEITSLENIFQPQDAERVFRDLATSDHQLIFGTSFSHGTPMLKVAPQFPKVAFEHCSGIKHLPNLGTFEAKYYEGTFVAGVAAGKTTKSNKIGFIGGFPIPDIVGPANALLLGAQSVNPAATCTVVFLNSWFDPAKEKEAATTLISQGCDVICSMTDTATGVQTAEEKGVWSIGYASDMSKFGPTKQITSFVLDWSSDYLESAKAVAGGTWKSTVRWDGLAKGIVKMAPYSKNVSAEAVSAAESAQAKIKAGTLHPYAGELKDQDGKQRVAAGGVLSDTDIRSMNWFVAGMVGKLS
jgi:basic membrane protein A